FGYTCSQLSILLVGSRLRHDLHLFPTRRSSDLGATSSYPASAWKTASESAPGCRQRAGAGHGRQSVAGYQPAPSAGSGRPAGSGDRKSTRLNSSHVKISYAVFCLKKNKPMVKTL